MHIKESIISVNQLIINYVETQDVVQALEPKRGKGKMEGKRLFLLNFKRPLKVTSYIDIPAN